MAGSRVPFNPFPIPGEDDQNQPSNRAIAPVLNFNRGGLPDIAFGYKTRFIYRRKNRYVLQVTASVQGIDFFAPDSDGNVGYTELGKLLGVKSPFIFVPDVYSLILVNASGSPNANDLTLSSFNISLNDLQTNEYLWANSPTNPNSEFSVLGFEIPLPILQYDDFVNIHDYLTFLNNVLLLPNGAVFNNASSLKILTIYQTLIYRLEQIPL